MDRLRLVLLSAGLLVSHPAPVHAQADTSRWIAVDRKPDVVVHVDRSQIDTIEQDIYRIRTKWELTSPRPGPDRKLIDRWLTHTTIDCRGLRSQDLEFAFYLGATLQYAATIPDSQRTWAPAPAQRPLSRGDVRSPAADSPMRAA